MARSSKSGPWLLGWRKIIDWLDEERLRRSVQKRNKKRSYETWRWERHIWRLLDEFTSDMAREGCLVKQMPGRYATWFLVEPDLPEVDVHWPDRDARDLGKGSISVRITAPRPDALEVLDQQLAQIRRTYPVEVGKPRLSGSGGRTG